jgi:hypothetical protein
LVVALIRYWIDSSFVRIRNNLLVVIVGNYLTGQQTVAARWELRVEWP